VATPGAGKAGLALAGRDGRWIAAEQQARALLGRDAEELGHCLVEAVLHPEDASAERARHAQLLSGALREYRAELRLVAGDGRLLWAVVEGRPAAGPAGRPEALVLLMADVSARRRLEAGGTGWALRSAEVDDAGAMVAVRDPEGRFVRVNAAFEERFRVSGEVLLGRADSYLFPLAVATALVAADAAARAAPGVIEGQDEVPLADGDHPLVAFRFALLGPTGVACGVCTVWGEPADRDAAAALADRLFAREREARAQAARRLAGLVAAEAAARAAALSRLPEFVAGAGEGLRVEPPPAAPGVDAERATRAEAERDRLAAELEERRGADAAGAGVAAAAETARAQAQAELAEALGEAARLRHQSTSHVAERERLTRELREAEAAREHVAREVAEAGAERDRLAVQAAEAGAERDRWAVQAAEVGTERDRLAVQAAEAGAERDRLLRELERLRAEREPAPAPAETPSPPTPATAPSPVGVGRFSRDVADARGQAPPSPWRSFGRRLLGHRRSRDP
jgi:PAS domain S-box-containing protein